jgi:hypothetical protein
MAIINAETLYWDKHEGKNLCGGGRMEDNIEIDLQVILCEGMDWINRAQDGV